MTVARVALSLYPAGLIACSVGGRNGPGPAIRDSAGIEIVENGVASGPWQPAIDSERTYPPELSYVAGALIRDDGQIVIANGGSAQILVVEPRRGSVRSLGRRGEGPGEFLNIEGVSNCARDTLAVFSSPSRLSVFAPAGEFRRQALLLPGGRPPWSTAGISADCQAAAVVTASSQGVGPTGAPRFSLTMAWFAPDSPLILPVANLRDVATLPDQSLLPFGDFPLWSARHDQVYVAASERAEIHTYERSGRLRRIIRWRATRQPLTAAHIRKYDSTFSALKQEFTADVTQGLKSTNEFDVPKTTPLLSRLLVDAERRLWVQQYPVIWPQWETIFRRRFDSEPARWWVFDAAGALLGETRTPGGLLLHDVRGSMMMGVVQDGDGIDRLRTYRFAAPRPTRSN